MMIMLRGAEVVNTSRYPIFTKLKIVEGEKETMYNITFPTHAHSIMLYQCMVFRKRVNAIIKLIEGHGTLPNCYHLVALDEEKQEKSA